MAGRPLVETEAKCGLTVSTSLRPSLVHLRVYCSNCTVAGNGSNQQKPFCSPGGYKMLSVGQWSEVKRLAYNMLSSISFIHMCLPKVPFSLIFRSSIFQTLADRLIRMPLPRSFCVYCPQSSSRALETFQIVTLEFLPPGRISLTTVL